MNCPFCNTPLSEDAKFCTACGKQIGAPVPTFTPKETKKQPILRSTNPALNIIKTIGSSPLFLTLTILYSVALVFSALFAVIGIPHMFAQIRSLMSELYLEGYNMQITALLQPVGGILSSVVLISLIPGILTAISLWITRFSARNPKNGGINTVGISIMFGVVVWELVVICLAALIMLLAIGILVVIALTVEPIDTETKIAMIVMAVAFVIALGIYVVAILYEIFMLRSLRTVRHTALTGEASDKVSSFAAIVLIVMGAFSAFSMLSAFDITVFVSAGCSAASTILGGVLMLSYRSEMKRLSAQEKPTAITEELQQAEQNLQ